MSTQPLEQQDVPLDVLYERAQNASVDGVRSLLEGEARSWGARLRELSALGARAERAGGHARYSLALELAGSWQISQLTADRWLAEAARFHDALPQTLAMLAQGRLLVHQAQVLLHRTQNCPPHLAKAVEAALLPQAAGWCPADLRRKVDRLVLRLEHDIRGGRA